MFIQEGSLIKSIPKANRTHEGPLHQSDRKSRKSDLDIWYVGIVGCLCKQIQSIPGIHETKIEPDCSMVLSIVKATTTASTVALVLPLLFVAVFLYLKRSKYASNTREVSSPPVSQTVQSGTDVSLLQRISQQDDSALSELYDRHASLLYTLILRILKDEHDAEDILQEVFLRIWDRAQTYDDALGSPTAWL